MNDEELLNVALHGGETEWQRLHDVCRDRNSAERLARMLEKNAHEGMDAAAAWVIVLQDLHADLAIQLPPQPAG